MNEKPTRRVVVKIDNLVLKGVRHEDRHAIAQGLQEQLTEMLSAPGMAEGLSQTGNIPHLRAGQVNVAADAKPQYIGIAAANGIGKGLGR
jgi:pSer/pThr/pTyr-binding forkhead associated (FHA) protein